MPASSISSFSDPGTFQEALGSAQVEVMIIAQRGFRSFSTDFEGQVLVPLLPPNATAFRRTLCQIGIVREALGVQAQDYPKRG